MSVDGIIFLLAFLSMVTLIAWTIWTVKKDHEAGIVYIENPSTAATSIGDPAETITTRTSRWADVVFGVVVAVIGVMVLYFLSTSANPLLTSSTHLRETASIIIVLGILSAYKQFRV